LSASLRDRVNVYNNLNKMINDAQESIELMTTEEGLIRKADALRKSLEKAKKRGVKLRIAAPITKKSAQAAEKLRQFGEVKDISSMKARFCIVDSKEVTFNLMDDEKAIPAYDVGIWVSTEFFAKALQNMFNQVWDGKKTALLVKNNN
jgi:sugar-specific transcriptional regulator TrmB